MPSQVAQVAPSAQQHVQSQPLQPINATQALQMQQQGTQMNQTQVAVGPATAAVAAQNGSQQLPTAHHQQYQYQLRAQSGAVSGQQQTNQHIQQQPSRYQQQNIRPPQYQTQPVVMPPGANNSSAIPLQHHQTQQQQIHQVNPQQRNNAQYSHRAQSQHQTQNQQPNSRSIPTPTSQNSPAASPVPTTAGQSHTPLYERLVTEEVKELKEYVRVIEQQSRRISDLEKIHLDLEKRLEAETTQRQKLEHTLQHRERHWKSMVDKTEEERSKMENNVKEEKIKVERLLDMVNRLQNEIQSMIKNKFNPSQAHANNNNGGGIKRVTSGQSGNRLRSESAASGRNEGHQSNSSRNVTKRHIGPHELLAYNGSAEAVRERNALTSLLDFFGM